MQDLEKYKAVQNFLCRKIGMKRIAKFSIILYLSLKLMWIFEVKSWLEHIANVQDLPYLLLLREMSHYFSSQNQGYVLIPWWYHN